MENDKYATMGKDQFQLKGHINFHHSTMPLQNETQH